jgi:hypothetical protein
MERPLTFVEHLFFAIVATLLLTINLVTLEVSISRHLLTDAEIGLLYAE